MVSEFPLGTPPAPQNFPYRNRVISGLCLGVVLVEAAENSGSLITARLGLEQGREIFAVPGNITSKNSFGTNYLIKSAGAKLVQQWQDVVSEFPPALAARMLPPDPKKEAVAAKSERLNELSEHERAVFKLLSADEPAHIDVLVEATGFSMPELTGALLGLEIQTLIKQLPGRCFIRNI
ncbi:MAG: DNA-processing protein DprA [Pyrinomonadaceae bacterium]